MKACIELTHESIAAIAERKHQQLFAREAAKRRFDIAQEKIKLRKSRNRHLVATALITVSVFFGLTNAPFTKPAGAQPGPIRAKSELSSKQLKALNVLSAKPEKKS